MLLPGGALCTQARELVGAQEVTLWSLISLYVFDASRSLSVFPHPVKAE